MKQQTFKPRKFLGFDFTPRKRYRAEIMRLERTNADLYRSFAAGEEARFDLLKKCAEERNLRLAAEAQLAKFRRKRGTNGKYTKDE